MKVIVIVAGANGFVSSHLVSRLLCDKYETVAVMCAHLPEMDGSVYRALGEFGEKAD